MSEDTLTETETAVLNALESSEKSLRPGDIAESTDIESKIVSKAIASLKKKGLIYSPKRCYYDVSKE
ncbi:MarR family transcriptional regulator [Methanococcoides sp. FTZ1]|uniref:MarR family transcriptional regulator n=1 Tax=Methanococcoides sp. FTZ1 TaxID=3439061 RepID=UPI003F845DAC